MYEAAGPLDAVVSAAGTMAYRLFAELEQADYEASFTRDLYECESLSPSMAAVDLDTVALAYAGSIESPETGQDYTP